MAGYTVLLFGLDRLSLDGGSARRKAPTYTQSNINTEQTHTNDQTWLRFEPTIPALERAKTVHVLDRAATVIGSNL
jgi:hypothetical protein